MAPPSRVVKRAPLPSTQPTRGVGKIIGESPLPGAGNSPPTSFQVSEPLARMGHRKSVVDAVLTADRLPLHAGDRVSLGRIILQVP